jgi:hypothetical protein
MKSNPELGKSSNLSKSVPEQNENANTKGGRMRLSLFIGEDEKEWSDVCPQPLFLMIHRNAASQAEQDRVAKK